MKIRVVNVSNVDVNDFHLKVIIVIKFKLNAQMEHIKQAVVEGGEFFLNAIQSLHAKNSQRK